MATATLLSPFGQQLRHWRQIRGMSQLELATQAESSPRHISFIETGRSRPTQPMVLRLAETLAVPLRDRNRLLEAAGLAPCYPERDLSDEEMAPVRRVVDHMLRQHEPFPAFVIDRWWTVVDASRTARQFIPPIDSGDPPNLVDLMFDPGSWRDLIVNWSEVAWASLARMRQEVLEAPTDERLQALVSRASRVMDSVPKPAPMLLEPSPVVCPILRFGDRTISTISTVARFGTAREITANELRIELILPGDEDAEQFFLETFGAGESTTQ